MGLSRRKLFNDKLKAVLGSNNVYFQPPEDRTLQYPCIIYQRDNSFVLHADDIAYHRKQRYQVTLIDANPDSEVYDKLEELPFSAFNRHFATSGLNHDVFVIYH